MFKALAIPKAAFTRQTNVSQLALANTKSWPTREFTRQTHVMTTQANTRNYGVRSAMAHTEGCGVILATRLYSPPEKE